MTPTDEELEAVARELARWHGIMLAGDMDKVAEKAWDVITPLVLERAAKSLGGASLENACCKVCGEEAADDAAKRIRALKDKP